MAVRFDDVDLVRDRELVERFQAGDTGGFEDLYRRYYHRLYRFCLKRITDPREAEEITQESFLRAFRALQGFGGERRFYPWLSVIAARLCIDTYRRQQRVETVAEIDLGAVDGGQEAVLDEVDRELLVTALARLNPRHREVLRLREEQGWSYQHIATHLVVSVGSVEALLWRARRALRREYLGLTADADALAGVPLLGWLLRRAADVRAWLRQVGDHAVPALANGAVSMAVVVASAGGLGALSRPPTVAAAIGSSSAAATRGAAVPKRVASVASLRSTGPGRASSGGATASGSSTSPQHHVVAIEDRSQRQRDAETSVETPLAGIDANPSAVLSATDRYAAALRRQL